MKRLIFRVLAAISLLIIVLVGFIAFRFDSLSEKTYTVPSYSIADDVKNADLALGQRIYAIRSGCILCHGENGAGAMVMDNGAMGSIHGANLTPFALKDWTDEEIANAIRYGVHKEGRSLQFMPSYDFASLSKGDIAAVVAYVRSLPTVELASHENSYGPIARMLSVFGKMPVMFPASSINLDEGFAIKPSEEPNARFGQYLANSCVGCHGENMAGGPIPGGDPSWPPAGNARLGTNPLWTKESFTQMATTGISPTTGEAIRQPMPVELIRQLNEDEITALWEYLKTLN